MKLVCFLLLAIGTAFSQEKGGTGKEPRSAKGSKGGKNHADLFFHHFDANEDGEVTREEFDAGRRVKDLKVEVRDELFKRLDKNKDGVIRKKEVKPSPGEKRPPHQQMRLILNQADLNKDGEITFAEFSEHPRFVKINEERRKVLFDRIDRNDDGVITPEDRPEPRGEGGKEGMKNFDLDENGSLSFAEFEHLPQHIDIPKDELRGRFNGLDSNADGQLSQEELKKGGRLRRSSPDRKRPRK